MLAAGAVAGPGRRRALGPAGSAVSADDGLPAFGAVVQLQPGKTYAQSVATSEARYGRLGVIRYFDRNAPDSWAGYRALWGDHSVILSFRIPPSVVNSGSQDAALRSFFANAPTDVDTYWAYMHEPEAYIARGEFTASAYRTAFARIAGLAAEADNPQLHATLVMMCYTVNPTSGRDWHNYYAEGAVQVIGWDCYNHKWRQGGYGTAFNLMGRAVATAQSTGLPWGIAELGSVKAAADDGSRRAAWLRECANYLIQNGAAFVSYFDTNARRTDYRLTDEPSRAAWDEFVADPVPVP